MIYNRRKRREFYAAQKALYAQHITDARRAVQMGTATEQQVGLVAHDDQLKEEEGKKVVKKGVLGAGKEWLFGGLKGEEGEEGMEGMTRVEKEEDGGDGPVMRAVREREEERLGDTAGGEGTVESVNLSGQNRGGMLDRLGESAPGSGSSGASWLPGWARRG